MQKLFSNIRTIQTRINYFNSAQVIKSVLGHKAPISEDTVQGRYASVIFKAASQAQMLDKVNDDMISIKQLYDQSEKFKEFLANVSFKRAQQNEVMESMVGTFNENTNMLIKALIDNKRLDALPKIVEKFIENYKILNKEENIRIISANELSKDDQKRVNEALKKSNAGVNFTIKYEVDPAIMGGLQMYSGNKFMDCSLFSRVQKIKGELQKLAF